MIVMTPAQCENNAGSCHVQVLVEALDSLIEPGACSFATNSLCAYNKFHVAL